MYEAIGKFSDIYYCSWPFEKTIYEAPILFFLLFRNISREEICIYVSLFLEMYIDIDYYNIVALTFTYHFLFLI